MLIFGLLSIFDFCCVSIFGLLTPGYYPDREAKQKSEKRAKV
jgi:hypothetical protein